MAQSKGELSDRYCAFIDILGFRQFVRGMTERNGKDRIANAIDLFERLEIERTRSDLRNLGLRLASFSDSIFISGPVSKEDGLGSFLWVVSRMAIACLVRGFLVRGAVVSGKIYHEGNIIFGPAVVDAVELESNHVRFPRIILTNSVRNHLRDDQDLAIISSDGPAYLHILSVFEELAKKSFDSDWNKFCLDDNFRRRYDYLKAIAKFIEANLETTRDYPRIFEKFEWFARYFDMSVIKKGNPNISDWPSLTFRHSF